MNRPRGGGRNSGGRGRRQPPPEQTGREAEFLSALVENGREVEVLLAGDRTVRGVLASFDDDALEIELPTRGLVRVHRREVRALSAGERR